MKLATEVHAEARTMALPEGSVGGARELQLTLPGGCCCSCCGARTAKNA